MGLASAGAASELTVDANGEPWEWVPHVTPEPSYDANDASFVFALNNTGTVLATCGGYSVIQSANGNVTAPGFTGRVIVGTNGANVWNGSNGNDLIVGLGGQDVIDGKQGVSRREGVSPSALLRECAWSYTPLQANARSAQGLARPQQPDQR